MLDIEIIDMDKDISTDSNKLGRDEKLEYSEINVQEMKDRANAYSPMVITPSGIIKLQLLSAIAYWRIVVPSFV